MWMVVSVTLRHGSRKETREAWMYSDSTVSPETMPEWVKRLSWTKTIHGLFLHVANAKVPVTNGTWLVNRDGEIDVLTSAMFSNKWVKGTPCL